MWNNFFVVSFFFRIFALFLKIIGIMKKIFLLMVASVLCVAGVKAEQTSLVATLSHDGNLSAFYGKEALKEAYNAAKEGDIITLSAGSFTGVDMSKNVVVRGVGMISDAKTDNGQTIIEGKFTITPKDNDYEFLLEGVYCYNQVTVSGGSSTKHLPLSISKCWFRLGITVGSYIYGKISHSIFSPWYSGNSLQNSLIINQGICQNCAISYIGGGNGSTPLVIQNCLLTNCINVSYLYEKSIGNATMTNCLIIGDGLVFRDVQDVHYCVGLNTSANGVNFFSSITNSTNKMVTDAEGMFKNESIVKKNTDEYGDVSSYTINWEGLTTSGTGLYELSDDAKALYKGNDGTVVGLWGGTMPFSMTPVNPRISKCEIVPKVDKDGKLSVTIEVAQ